MLSPLTVSPSLSCRSERLSDMAIIVSGGVAFPAHRVVLAAASPRLRAMLESKAPEQGKKLQV